MARGPLRAGDLHMDKNTIAALAADLTDSSPLNFVSPGIALSPACAGMKLFEPPVFGFGCPDDELFTLFKSPGIIGGHFLSPREWLPCAKTVISFFLPYTSQIKSANSRDCLWPADEWLHGRFEGQLFAIELSKRIEALLSSAGYECLVPALDSRLKTGSGESRFSSNWSERHAAFVCGLGTFGLSKGLITEKGVCGRFGSVLTAFDLPKDTRRYKDIYEYCTMCGACAPQCPAGSISLADGKDSASCSAFLNKTTDRHRPRYGCGKCQVSVPCESGIPKN